MYTFQAKRAKRILRYCNWVSRDFQQLVSETTYGAIGANDEDERFQSLKLCVGQAAEDITGIVKSLQADDTYTTAGATTGIKLDASRAVVLLRHAEQQFLELLPKTRERSYNIPWSWKLYYSSLAPCSCQRHIDFVRKHRIIFFFFFVAISLATFLARISTSDSVAVVSYDKKSAQIWGCLQGAFSTVFFFGIVLPLCEPRATLRHARSDWLTWILLGGLLVTTAVKAGCVGPTFGIQFWTRLFTYSCFISLIPRLREHRMTWKIQALYSTIVIVAS